MSKVFKQDTPVQTESQVKRGKKFIEKARKIHGDKYDYSEVIYTYNKLKIKIICPEHGEFEQVPKSHIEGHGCPKCGAMKKRKNRLLTTKEFIEKAIKVHGDKYDYSDVVYTMSKNKIKIICPEHGEFEQIARNHLQGKGCLICALENKKYIVGKYIPEYPEKYSGNIDNLFYRSSYELKAFQMIENDKSILKWSYETEIIPYESKTGSYHNYYVDIKIWYDNKISLIEIKPENKLIPNIKCIDEYNKNQAKWKAAKKYCKERNWEFKIWTEKELGI